MSNEPLNNDDLATEEMLKMYESEVGETPEPEALEAQGDAALDMSLADLPLDDIDDNITLDDEVLAVSESIDAPIPSADTDDIETLESASTVNSESDDAELPMLSTSTQESEALELADTPKTPDNSMSSQLTAVVDNAMQALQDWMEVRHLGGDKGNPAQHLAQLDSLLDTVNQQQQSLATQLENAVRLNGSLVGAAQTLGVALPSPEALGWKDMDWQTRATAVADKTDSIAAMNAKLRQQIASL